MKFLIDNSLSPRIAEWLTDAGHDAVHVLTLGMADAKDAAIFDKAAADEQVIVSMDTDFGTLLALRKSPGPSVILLRRDAPSHPKSQAELLLSSIPAIQSELEQGAIAVFDAGRIRIRSLPISE